MRRAGLRGVSGRPRYRHVLGVASTGGPGRSSSLHPATNRISCGSPISPSIRRERARCTAPWSSMPGRAGSSAGRSTRGRVLRSSPMHSGWPSTSAARTATPSSTATKGRKVNSSGCRNSSLVRCSMATMRERQREVQGYRGQIPSPGRPTVAWREDRVRFWSAITRGLKTEDAAREAGVSSPVGFRWFRHAGGVNPHLAPTVTGRFLSFAEREDVAIWRAQQLGVREIARRLTEALRRSRGSCAAMHRRGRGDSNTRPRLRSGMRSDGLDDRRLPSSIDNERLREYDQDRLSWSRPRARRAGSPVRPGPKWKGRNKPHRGDRRWVSSMEPGANNRTGSGVAFPMMRRCASATRRSIRPSMLQSRGALAP